MYARRAWQKTTTSGTDTEKRITKGQVRAYLCTVTIRYGTRLPWVDAPAAKAMQRRSYSTI